MAIFQPTNIVPSSFTEGTVDAVKDNMEVSWQVNGNSAMTAFQIDFYLNDTASTLVYSTGKLPKAGETQAQYNLPFYGTDRFGRPQFFTWDGITTWEDKGFTNGNNYKFKITQWYKGGEIYSVWPVEFGLGKNYFSFVDTDNQIQYISFAPPIAFTRGVIVTYNLETSELILLTPAGEINVSSTKSTTRPDDGTYLGSADNVIGVKQNSFSAFITRTTPTLTLQQTDENFLNPVALSNTLNTSKGYFHAEYIQEQNDPIRWIRWQIATATKNKDNTYTAGDILVDTGDIYTPTLNFEFNGFFNGNSYAIRCTGESESGQATQLQGANSDGWIFFDINYTESTYTGTFTAQCINKENATLLEWDGVEVILPTTQGDYTLNNGSITLPAESTISWQQTKEDVVVPFNNHWTAVWKGKIILQTERKSVAVSGMMNKEREYNGQRYFYFSSTYTITPGINKILKTEVKTYSPTVDDIIYELVPQQTENGISATIYLMSKRAALVTAEINYTLGEPASPKGKLFSAFSNAGEIVSINQDSNTVSNQFTVTVNETDNIIPIHDLPTAVAFSVSPNSLTAYFYSNNSVLYQQTILLTYTQQPITSVQIFGGDNGATVESVSVFDNTEKQFNIANYENPDFEPSWNDPNYNLYMTANFNGNIQGGTGNAEGNGFQVYRREVGGNVLTPIANVSALVTSLKDYGIRSRKAYEYLLGVYDSNNAFMGLVTAQNTIATCFKNYSLLVCTYDQDKDEYHVRKQYLFALNLSTGSVGNNNSPTLNANFTRYPTRMPSTQNYASGTLQGLIGAIYTVPALIEQIGQYKYTAKPSTLDYFDSVDLEKELYDLSTAPYQLFLRDMKGRLRMIATSGAISMTTNIKQKQQSISISFPWVEIGDASDVTIIQTPDDYGWNNDNQVLDVQLDVDVATGELSATYPFPYNGTKFYLTGVNQENLTAKTPLGITPAQFNLSEVAEEPNDGEVTAIVKVNGGGD